MRARSQMIVKTSDPESVTSFVARSTSCWCRVRGATLRELYDEVRKAISTSPSWTPSSDSLTWCASGEPSSPHYGGAQGSDRWAIRA